MKNDVEDSMGPQDGQHHCKECAEVAAWSWSAEDTFLVVAMIFAAALLLAAWSIL